MQQFNDNNHSVEFYENDNKNVKKEVLEFGSEYKLKLIRLRELILRQVFNYEQLITLAPHLYPYPKNCIVKTIIEDYKISGADSDLIQQIYRIFANPEYDQYKNHVYNSARRRKEADMNAMLDGERYAVDIQIKNTIQFLEDNIDNQNIQNWLERHTKERQKKLSREKRDLEEEDKETIPRPPWMPEGVAIQDSLLYRSAIKMVETWQDVAIRIGQFPPRPENDQWYAEGIDTLRALLVPGTDLKYVRDTLSYFDISYEKNTQSIHSAMSKSKMLTHSGKWRKMTREQIADIDPQIILLAIHVIEKIPGLMHLFIYLMDEQKPCVAEFHLNRHSKLSEGAFGNSGFLDDHKQR